MNDRKHVIKGLMGLHGAKETMSIIADAITLLKEQEAVKPKYIDGKRNHFIKCGNCNYDLLTGYMFCPHCGKAVKWE